MTSAYFAYVDCRGDVHDEATPCGTVGLTFVEYDRQLSRPNALWYCPRCGSSAFYNDDMSEKVQFGANASRRARPHV